MSKEHLIPFKPGQSGNPGGRPKSSMTEVLRQVVAAKGPDGKTKREHLAEKLVALAEKGDVAALKYIFDRCDGSPPASVKIKGSAEEPVHVRSSDRPAADG